jgi:DNA-binding transcriptional LysR family regulator
VNLQQLRYLVVVAQLGAMTRAAQALHIGQPALTQAIRNLEREVGTPLFERTSRGVVLTDAGRVLVSGATRALAELDGAVEEVAVVRAASRPTVVLATRPAAGLVPGVEIVRRIRATRPGTVVRIVSCESADEVVDAVAAGEVDLGLTDLAAPALSLIAHEVGSHQFVAYFPPGSQVRDGAVGPDELGAHPLIGAPTAPRWGLVDGWLLGAGRTGDVAVEVTRRDMLIPLVAAGLGAAIYYDFARDEAERLGVVVRDLDWEEGRPVWLVRGRRVLSDDAEAAWTLITNSDGRGSPKRTGSSRRSGVQ